MIHEQQNLHTHFTIDTHSKLPSYISKESSNEQYHYVGELSLSDIYPAANSNKVL